MGCPKCDGEDWKSASFVYQSGTIDVDTSTITGGIAAGIGSDGVGGGIGVSSGSTTGQHQSTIAKITAPPDKPVKPLSSTAYAIIVMIITILVADKSEFLGYLLLIGATFFWFNVMKDGLQEEYKKSLKKYNRDIAVWEKTRVCQRCGCLYVPPTS